MVTKNPADDIAAGLGKRVSELLNGCLGALPYPIKTTPSARRLVLDSPSAKGLTAGLAYALLFCALPWLFFEQPERHLFWLSIYGSFYAAWATFLARSTSAKILTKINRQIIPMLSPDTAHRIDADLAQHFANARLSLLPWLIAILGATAAGLAISRDVGNVPFQIAWWSVGWLFLFVTAARSTDVARFYYFFAKNLYDEPNIYVLDPAHSTLVRQVSAVGQHILTFWVGILLAVAFLIPFVSLGNTRPPLGQSAWDFWLPTQFTFAWLRLPTQSAFAWLVIPLTSFFSIPFGTVVFLKSENALRRAVDKVLQSTLLGTETDIAKLLCCGELTELQWTRISDLRSLHKDLIASGSYQSFLASGLSLLIPLIGPLVELLKYLPATGEATSLAL